MKYVKRNPLYLCYECCATAMFSEDRIPHSKHCSSYKTRLEDTIIDFDPEFLKSLLLTHICTCDTTHNNHPTNCAFWESHVSS